MRLTLRTLLAYLDDILEPADARELGQKIEESEFASGLVHRIRSVTRKLRLGAPKLAGKGMGLDANTVAEYLDNTLPQDRVPDFEKVCLESDVHFAEVASCHQILTLVLGEPADVDPALRERIRDLQARIAAVAGEQPETLDEHLPVATPTPPPVDRRQAEWDQEPDMPLIAPSPTQPTSGGTSVRLLPVAGTLVVVFLLALVALVAMGPLDSDHPILGRFLADASPNASPPGDFDQQPEVLDRQADAAPAQNGQQRDTPALSPATTVEARDKDRPPLATGTGTQPSSDAKLPSDAAKTNTVDAEAFPPPAADAGPPVAPDASAPADTESVPGTSSVAMTAKSDPTGSSEKVAETAVEPEPLARYTSDLHILAHYDPATETWLRLATNDPIAADQRLIAFPTYRPQIALSTGVRLTLVGPAIVSLMDPDAEGVAGITLHSGRVIAVADGKPDAAVKMRIGDRTTRVSFRDLDATLALEVRRYLPPGADPQEITSSWMAGALAAAGRLAWLDVGAADATILDTGQLATIIGKEPPRVTTTSTQPDWLDAGSLRPIDRDASRQLQPLLEHNRPLTTSLLEQVGNRLVEVRAVAIRSLCLLDIYDPFVSAFNAKELRTFWPDLFETLQAHVAQSPDTAQAVRTTLERLRGEDGTLLYRLLWGYSPQQLAEGDATKLVAMLSDPAMDIRVLTYENLNRIVGKTNSYHPEFDPGRQRRAILNWERDLKQGEIVYKTPPIELPE